MHCRMPEKESDQRDTEDVTEEGKIWGVDSYDTYVKRILRC